MHAPSRAITNRASKPGVSRWPDRFAAELLDLFLWRRDELHFRTDPLPDGTVASLVETACLAPSAGNAQPWRFVDVQCAKRRAHVIDIFQRQNVAAADVYSGRQASSYATLKLAGMREAPVHHAVFCDEDIAVGHGLGRQTMLEMLRYSVVCAVHTLWLAAQARGLALIGFLSSIRWQFARASMYRLTGHWLHISASAGRSKRMTCQNFNGEAGRTACPPQHFSRPARPSHD